MRTEKIIMLIEQLKKYNYSRNDLEKLTKNQMKFFSAKIEETEEDMMEVVATLLKENLSLDEQLQGWLQYQEEVGDIGDILDTLNESVVPVTEVKEEPVPQEGSVEPKKRGRPKGTLKDVVNVTNIVNKNIDLAEIDKSIAAKFNTVDLPIISPADKLKALKKDWVDGLIKSRVTFKEFQSFVEEFKETVSDLYFSNAVLDEKTLD